MREVQNVEQRNGSLFVDNRFVGRHEGVKKMHVAQVVREDYRQRVLSDYGTDLLEWYEERMATEMARMLYREKLVAVTEQTFEREALLWNRDSRDGALASPDPVPCDPDEVEEWRLTLKCLAVPR